jgi:hypothetical protein
MSSGEQIVIEGRLSGRAVSATWYDGNLIGDAILVVATQFIAASAPKVHDGTTLVDVTLRTLPGATIALMRALDEIESICISALRRGVTPLRVSAGN